MNRRACLLVFGAILAAATALRTYRLDADPDAAFGTAYLTDEGFYAKNAKLRVTSGHWLAPGDNHNHLFLAPLAVGMNAAAFAVAGPSLLVARALAAACGLALVAAAAAWTWRAAGARAGLLVALLAACDPALVQLSRIALPEAPLALGTVALFAAWTLLPRGRSAALAVSGLWILAFLIKASAVALIPAVAVAYLLDAAWDGGRRALGELAVFLLASCSALLIWRWGLCSLSPAARFMIDFESAVHVGSLAPEAVMRTAIAALRAKPALVGLGASPVVAVLAMVGAVATITGNLAPPGPKRRLAIAASAWLVGQGLFFSLMPYQAYRYFLALGAPAAVLAALVLGQLGALAAASAWRRPVAALATAGATALVVHHALPATSRLLALGVGAVAAASFALVAERKRAALAAALVLAGVAIGLAARNASRPLLAPSFEEAAMLARVSADLGPGDTVVGFFADTATLDGPARSLVVHGAWNSAGDPFARFAATSLLVEPQEERWIRDRWPAIEARLVARARFAPAAGARGVVRFYGLSAARSGE